MTSNTQRPPKFYSEDLVQDVNAPQRLGIVLKTWHDDELPDNIPLNLLSGIEVLKEGQCIVHFVPSGPSLVTEQSLRLIDRNFQPGDYCKRSADEIRSGVVISEDAKGKLAHAISGEAVPGWKTIDDLEESTKAQIGDHIIYNDWIGQVIEVFDEILVETSAGRLVSLPEMHSPFAVGDKGTDILPSHPQMPSTNLSGGRPDTVVAVEHIMYAICWLALNQSLSPLESQSRTRPKRFWYGAELSQLTRLCNPYTKLQAGAIVRLKKSTNLPKTIHTDTTEPTASVTVQSYIVKETETSLRVLWQDGDQEDILSTDLIPHLTVDEHDCWPGDHVIWRSEDQQRPAVVQQVNASDRTATVLFTDSNIKELVSLLELDPHTSTEADPLGDDFGIRQGDLVFIHPDGQTNGLEPPHVPRIGELEAWAKELPTYDEQSEVTGWRREMFEIGNDIVTRRANGHFVQGQIKDSRDSDGSLNWLGHVTYLRLDGSVEVTHPDQTRATYRLDQLTKLYDTLEQVEDVLYGQADMDSEGAHSEDDWMDEDNASETSDFDMHEEVSSIQGSIPTGDEMDAQESNTITRVPDDDLGSNPEGAEQDSHWRRFDILPSVPLDHAFHSSSPAQPSKNFLGRLQREYKILSSSLPDTILVRAYEDRTDLLRSLIMGPDNTPYEDAPFVIDWQLDSNFPNSPPIAHFHSWTNGNGRVNPNLYEEGKVCLSILGTWQGDRTETWSPARSSLLQAFVSIQGLVLVKEPWYCEPGYEKMRGTEDANINSRLYSEKAFVLSRGFVRRALEIPVGSFESELNWMYYQNKRLERVLIKATSLIGASKESRSGLQDLDAAIPLLTTGGIILLERILGKLQALWDSNGRKG